MEQEEKIDFFEPPMSPFCMVDPEEYAMYPEEKLDELQRIPEGRILRFSGDSLVRLAPARGNAFVHNDLL